MFDLNNSTLKGTYPALATPFTADGSAVDYASLEKLIEFQIAAGINGLVICGSTGEASTLTDDEYREVVRTAGKIVNGRIPCVAGIGSGSTARAAEIAAFLSAEKLDGILVVTPPYIKPLQHGITEHFRCVKKVSASPLIAYNIPGRTGTNIQPQTLAKLCEEKIIIGVKDSTGSLDQIIDLAALTGDALSILSGEDSLVHSIMMSGGTGVISATANVIPGAFRELTDAALEGDCTGSLERQIKILPVVRAMFTETNPIPVKAALRMKGIIAHDTVRLPLTKISKSCLDLLTEAFDRAGL